MPRLGLILTLVIAGCGSLQPPLPSEEEAVAHLAQVVEIVGTGDLTSICELGSGTCPTTLREVDRARIPREPPVVVGRLVVQPSRRADGGWTSGGVLLALCGVDGTGEPYGSEMLVFRNAGGDLISINTLYWLGAEVADADAPVGPDAGGCPA